MQTIDSRNREIRTIFHDERMDMRILLSEEIEE